MSEQVVFKNMSTLYDESVNGTIAPGDFDMSGMLGQLKEFLPKPLQSTVHQGTKTVSPSQPTPHHENTKPPVQNKTNKSTDKDTEQVNSNDDSSTDDSSTDDSSTDKETHSNKMTAEVTRLSAEADEGSTQALGQLCELLDVHPEIWQHLGELGQHAESILVGSFAKMFRGIGQYSLYAESIRRQIAQTKSDLLGPNPTALERLAVQRVVLVWQHLQLIDMLFVDDRSTPPSTAVAKCRMLAEKRYLQAMKALELTQRMKKRTQKMNVRANTP